MFKKILKILAIVLVIIAILLLITYLSMLSGLVGTVSAASGAAVITVFGMEFTAAAIAVAGGLSLTLGFLIDKDSASQTLGGFTDAIGDAAGGIVDGIIDIGSSAASTIFDRVLPYLLLGGGVFLIYQTSKE
jgi:hypothetical protein